MNIKILELKESILEDNDADADLLRMELRHDNTFYINVMSSPGAGKTSMLSRTINELKNSYSIGVLEADIDSDVDAQAIASLGVRTIQVHTGGMCHLDADMSRQSLKELMTEDLNIVFLENVGNLVCPAEFDTGAFLNIVLLSVPEGDDKPLKYPLMFQKADAVLVTKTDAMEAFDFDLDRFKANVEKRHPGIPVFPLSAVTGEGYPEWCGWLSEQTDEFLQEEKHV